MARAPLWSTLFFLACTEKESGGGEGGTTDSASGSDGSGEEGGTTDSGDEEGGTTDDGGDSSADGGGDGGTDEGGGEAGEGGEGGVDSGGGGEEGGGDGSSEPEWGYEGDIGPEHWGELSEDWAVCATGTVQSPVDIVSSDLIEGSTAGPALDWTSTALAAYSSGHYLRYNIDEGSTLTWAGEVYDLAQFHFHAHSEHTVDGVPFDMEVHFVHYSQSDPSRAAVIAGLILADDIFPNSEAFSAEGDLMFHDALALPISEEASNLGSGTVDLGLLFSELGLYRTLHYTGSLTTPPCSEGVEFFVVDYFLRVPSADIAAFQAVYPNNFRPTQPLNGRTVEFLLTGSVPE